MNVLICDDSKFMRNIIKNQLKSIDKNIVIIGEASDGEEAVEKYKSLKPDLVTMDITMDKKDGMTALKDIMRFDKNAKVIMVSSMGQQHIILDTIKVGAVDFVIKPFDREALLKSFNCAKKKMNLR